MRDCFRCISIALRGGLFLGIVLSLHAAGPEKKSSPGTTPLPDPSGIHNLYALGTNVYSGSSPEGEEGFAALARLGVKTIITVDGAKPEVETAKKYGMRYVHLPLGYDGISTKLQRKLAKAAEVLPGPFYVHCHHGKHRGPAAAAVICLANEGWTPDQAEAWLVAAGTSTNYEGLYEVVREFKKPSAAELQSVPTDFPETAEVSGLVESMVGINERWEHLKGVRDTGFASPKNHPDIEPANEAVILWEHYREAQRLPESVQHGDEFVARLKSAELEAKQAERLLRQFEAKGTPDIRAQLDRTLAAMGRSCASCHKNYRDPASK